MKGQMVHSPHEVISTMGKTGQDHGKSGNHAKKHMSILATNQCQIS